MKNWLTVGCALFLAGCGSSENPTVAEANAVEVASVTTAADAPLEIVITQFPASYFGRWGLTEGDCALGASDATGLISVQGSLVKFYESTATMRNGKRETLTSVSADFDVAGEGEKWQNHARYSLFDDRKQLTREDVGTGERYVYKRCPD